MKINAEDKSYLRKAVPLFILAQILPYYLWINFYPNFSTPSLNILQIQINIVFIALLECVFLWGITQYRIISR